MLNYSAKTLPQYSIIQKDYDSLDTSTEVGLGRNTKKIKYTFMSHQHNAYQNHNTNKANKSFKKWQSSEYLQKRL